MASNDKPSIVYAMLGLAETIKEEWERRHQKSNNGSNKNEEDTVPKPVDPNNMNDLKICPVCGAKYDIDIQECRICGAPLPPDVRFIVCHNCDTELDWGTIVCPICGADLVNREENKKEL